MKRLPPIALLGFVAATVVVHAVVGWWQPLQTDDWEHLLWDVRHDGGWLGSHFTSSDMLGYALAHGRLLHAAVCGVAFAALVIGAFVIARRRLPRPAARDDVLEVIAISALLWITQPRAGFTWFDRPNVAAHLCGCAAALWLIAPFRCGWRVGRGGVLALAAAGLFVGTSSRQIATAALVGLAVWMRRTPPPERARWMHAALGALAAGATAGFIDAPHVELYRVFHRGLEPNLIVLNLPIRENGQLIALVVLLALAKLALDALRPGAPRDPAPPALPEPRETRAWFWTWLGICVICLFGPRYSEATLLPATTVLVIAALPYVRWLCTTRLVGRAVVAIAIGVHAIAWPTALGLFARLDDEFRDRVTRLERAPAGSVAVIAPYSENLPSSWFFGEDWSAASRQLVGIELYGVRDIAFDPRFGKLEDNPGVEIALDADGLTAEQRRSASPAYWATDVSSAREQFELFVERAERAAGDRFTARLAVAGIDFPQRRGRPLEAARYERGALLAPRALRGNPDPNDRQQITLPPAVAAAYPEAYAVRGGASEPLRYDGSALRVRPMVAGLLAVVACEPRRCLLVDAFRPRF